MEGVLAIHTTYEAACADLAHLMDEATDNREIVIIEQPDGDSVGLIAADELTSLLETAYLLRSPANARRLLEALESALQSGG